MEEFQQNLGELINEYDTGDAETNIFGNLRQIHFAIWDKYWLTDLGELINEYDTGDAEDALAAPQNRHLRVENKNFYFDIKRNAQGRYMTISEVKGNFRNSILIPEIGWENFRDVLDDYVKQVKEGD